MRRPPLRTASGCSLCLEVRSQGLKRAEEPGKRSAEQYSPAWLLLRDHPPTCPLPLLRPRANPHPNPHPRPPDTELRCYPGPQLGTASTCFMCNPPSCLGWVLFPATPALPVPRVQGEDEVDLKVRGLRGVPSPSSMGNHEHTANSTTTRQRRARSRPLGISSKTRGQVRPSSTLHHPTPYALSWARASEVPLRSGGILHSAHSPPGAQSAGSY